MFALIDFMCFTWWQVIFQATGASALKILITVTFRRFCATF